MPEDRDREALVVGTDPVPLEAVHRIAVEGARVELGPGMLELMHSARAVVEEVLARDEHTYGLNSGLGHGRDDRLAAGHLRAYGLQTLDAHAAGVGPPLPEVDVRALMAARLIGLTRGGAGVHPRAVLVLAALLNAGVTPIVPRTGSVGAADLMHLAAIGQVIAGRGLALYGGESLPAAEALRRAGVEPHTPEPHDALCLISGNAASIGLGALAVLRGERLAALADLAGVLTLEAIGGSTAPLESEAAAAKRVPGQIAAAAHLRALLVGSERAAGPAGSLQDPLSVRVMPQVHGALRETLRAAREQVQIELNARDDNPLVSVAGRRMIPTGNFHPLALALAFESLRVALAHVGMLSERRMNKLLSFSFGTGKLYPDASWAPGRYAEEGVLAYSAAALVAHLKHLAQPVTLGSPPLDFDVEDHATLAPSAVFLARESMDALETILAIEVVLAVDRLSSSLPRRLGAMLEPVYRAVLDALQNSGDEPVRGAVVEAARDVLRRAAF